MLFYYYLLENNFRSGSGWVDGWVAGGLQGSCILEQSCNLEWNKKKTQPLAVINYCEFTGYTTRTLLPGRLGKVDLTQYCMYWSTAYLSVQKQHKNCRTKPVPTDVNRSFAFISLDPGRMHDLLCWVFHSLYTQWPGPNALEGWDFQFQKCKKSFVGGWVPYLCPSSGLKSLTSR